jgi:hypothetical protein
MRRLVLVGAHVEIVVLAEIVIVCVYILKPAVHVLMQAEEREIVRGNK